MGMFDTIINIPVKCPRCGDYGLKSTQIKSGPQMMNTYKFGKDKIDINWDYEYYDSIIDKDKRIIRGIAVCGRCKEDVQKKMDELIKDALQKGELKCPEGVKYLIECEINGEDALGVILDRLGENRNIEFFDIAIFVDKEGVPIAADVIVDVNKEH